MFLFLQKRNKKEANRCFFHSLFFLYILIQEAILKREPDFDLSNQKEKRDLEEVKAAPFDHHELLFRSKYLSLTILL